MSKLIVEMEMPRGCPCDLIGVGYDLYCSGVCGIPERVKEYYECVENGTRPDWCPICGVLPDEHGDLVDADTVLWGEEVPDSEGIVVPVTIGDVIDGYDVQIVIAAERKDDEQQSQRKGL